MSTKKSAKSKSEEAEDDVDDEGLDEGAPDGADDGPEDDKPMSFWEHLDDLRKRLVRSMLALFVGCAVAWYYKEKLLAGITKPFCDAWVEQGVTGPCDLHFSTPGGDFAAYFTLSLIGGAVIAAPVVFYQLWAFVAPGLYAKEKKYVIPFVGVSTLLFLGGGYFGFLTALPITFGYFLGMSGAVEGVVNIKPTIMMEDYIDFVVKMALGFGAIFEIPILFTFLARTGLVNHKQMLRWARYYIFVAFLVAGILTPPDWASQLVMAFPAVGLYFGSIGLVYVFQKRDALARWEEAQREREEAKKQADEDEKAAEKKKRQAERAKAKAKAKA